MVRLPRYTCPDINAMQRTLEQASSDIEYYAVRLESEDDRKSLEFVALDVYGTIASLEDLRADNSALREYGLAMERERDELEKDLDCANEEIKELTRHISKLESHL